MAHPTPSVSFASPEEALRLRVIKAAPFWDSDGGDPRDLGGECLERKQLATHYSPWNIRPPPRPPGSIPTHRLSPRYAWLWRRQERKRILALIAAEKERADTLD